MVKHKVKANINISEKTYGGRNWSLILKVAYQIFRYWYNFPTTSTWFPASEASREVENFTERKNQHTPVYGVKEFVCEDFMIFHQTRNQNIIEKNFNQQTGTALIDKRSKDLKLTHYGQQVSR